VKEEGVEAGSGVEKPLEATMKGDGPRSFHLFHIVFRKKQNLPKEGGENIKIERIRTTFGLDGAGKAKRGERGNWGQC